MERSAARIRALEALRSQDAVAEPGDTAVKQQCNHFSIREYVALLQKKDSKLYFLSPSFCKQQHQDEHHNLCPVSAKKFRRWNCSGCLDKVKIADRATSIDVSPEQNGTSSGCSISFIRTVWPTSVCYTRQFPCTQRLSQGNEAGQPALSTQECNSKCNSPSGSNGALTEMNVDLATKESQEAPDNLDVMENMLNDASMDVSVLPEITQIVSNTAENGTKESQEPPNNLDVMKNIPNDASLYASTSPDSAQKISSATENGTKDLHGSPDNLDVMANVSKDVPVDDSPEAPQIISSKENGTQKLRGPKSCEMLNDDEYERSTDVLDGDCSVLNVAKPTEHKVRKPTSGHKGSQLRNRCPHQASSKRNAGSSSKKKQNKPTYPSDISDRKFCQRKPKRMRRLSELIETDQIGGTNSIDVHHARTNDLCENDKCKFSLEVDKDTDAAVSIQRAEEIQSRTVQNKPKLRVDDVDDQSSLMNWLKRTHKKVRTEKNDPGHRDVDSTVVSTSAPGILASEKLHHHFVPSDGDQIQEEVPETTNAKLGNENMQNNCRVTNVWKTHDLCQNEPSNSKQRSLLNGKTTILLKRKVPPTDNAKYGGTKAKNRIVKKNSLKTDDKCQMASENSEKGLKKVSGKCDTHNVSGIHEKKMATDKKKRKLQILDKQTEIDDIPMDIVELLARHQHERQLMTDAGSLENSHSQPKITQDSDQIAAKNGSVDASTVLDNNFQESSISQRRQKILIHASSSTETATVHPLEELDVQMSVQGHTVSGTEIPKGQMQNSLPAHAASITEAFHVPPPQLRIPDILMCTEEQQTHSHMDKEVTIACISPTFPRHQDIAEVPTQSLGTNRTKKLMWDSFKMASRNPSAPSYGAQFRSGFREVGSAPALVYDASNNYPTYSPGVEYYTKKAVNQVPLRNQAMETGRLYDQRTSGPSGLYPREPMPATHLLRLMDSSTASGFTNKNRIEFEASGSSRHMPHQYNASLSTSYGSLLIEKFPITVEELSRRQVQKNLHRPLRPLPRVGVLGSMLQQDIAKWSEHCGTHTGYSPGVSKVVAPFDANRRENCAALNSVMFSARWNALQLGSVSSAASPEYSSARYCEPQYWARGREKVVHPLDKLVRKDICQTNSNPADFTIICDKNEYMISL